MAAKKDKPIEPPKDGLVGFHGHTYIPADDDPEAKEIQYQFEIIRKIDGDRYVVQYFSFWDGSPTELGVYPEAELLGPTVKLYANQELWNTACEKAQGRKYDRLRHTGKAPE